MREKVIRLALTSCTLALLTTGFVQALIDRDIDVLYLILVVPLWFWLAWDFASEFRRLRR